MTGTKGLHPDIVRKVNGLWLPVYPGIAKQIAELCDGSPARILEIGCFSGGVGLTLLKMFPSAGVTVALEYGEMVRSFWNDWEPLMGSISSDRVNVVSTPVVPLALAGGAHDLVVCRGVFFFLDERGTLISEIDRMLATGGFAFFGGGFGSYTPDSIRDELADESRRLNHQMGKRTYSSEEFSDLIDRCGLGSKTQIVQDGGLWAVLRK